MSEGGVDDQAFAEASLEERIRSLIRGELHVNRLSPGDRLPSIRELAREHGADHRGVARVYDRLAREGLVEIRRRSGVFVARTVRTAELSGTDAWIGRILCEARSRHISLPELSQFISRLVDGSIQCALLESTEDHIVACEEELARRFGLTVVPFRLRQRGSPGRLAERERLGRLLRQVHVAVTTSFHLDEVRDIATQAGTPIIGVSVSERFAEIVQQRLQKGKITVVAADASYIDRAQAYFGQAIKEGRLRMLPTHDPRATALRPGPDVLFTRAARRRMGFHGDHLLDDNVPFFSPAAVSALVSTMIHIAGRNASVTAPAPTPRPADAMQRT
jgi:DNA-binding transcriptional regulator YhcF (GntR family)